MIQAVLFDLIGTTVKEKNNDVVLNCIKKAFSEYIKDIDVEVIKQYRGLDKKIMIKEVLKHYNCPYSLSPGIHNSFKQNFENNLDAFSEMDDASDVFYYLEDKKIKTGIGTGLSKDLFEKIYEKLGWRKYNFEYVGTADDVETGRPEPDMIIDMMSKLSITNKNNFLKVGDTVADIREGKKAGVVTAVILSGSQDKNDLIKQSPDYVITSLVEIKNIVEYFL